MPELKLHNNFHQDQPAFVLEVRENIQLKRRIGSYQGLRHAMGLPVRGQHTRNNGKTAKKLNRLDRRGFATSAYAQGQIHSSTGVFAAFKNLFGGLF